MSNKIFYIFLFVVSMANLIIFADYLKTPQEVQMISNGEMVTEVFKNPECIEGYGVFDVSLSSNENFSILSTSVKYPANITSFGNYQLTLPGNGLSCFDSILPSEVVVSIQPYESNLQTMLAVSSQHDLWFYFIIFIGFLNFVTFLYSSCIVVIWLESKTY